MARTTMGYRPAARFGGICALILVAEVIISGSGWLFNVTHTPPNVVGKGFAAEESLWASRLPLIETKAPGARFGVKFAMFTTPLFCTWGAVAALTGVKG